MTGRSSIRFLAVVLAAGALVGAASAQTSGSISGAVADESGGALPGVTVEARGPSLQGARSAVTDTAGQYRLALLPTGTYTVTFSLPSFATETRAGIAVGLGGTTALDVVMRVVLNEQVEVTGQAPLVDTSSTGLDTNLSSRTIQALPTGRNYSAVVQILPGTSSDANPLNADQSTITVYGSSGAENSFFIDGVNTTNLEYGFQGKELNFEFIDGLDVKTGGYQAEYGRSTGGIINVVTKSGGNEFHGDAFGYFDNDSQQASAKPVVSTSGTVAGFTKEDWGGDLGGYVVQDRLWFFGAYDRVEDTLSSILPAGPQAGQVVKSRSTRNLASAKLTYRLAENQSLVATLFRDPRADTGAINDANHGLNGDPLTYAGRLDRGGTDAALRYDGILAASWVVSAQVAQHEEKNSVGPASSAGDVIQYLDAANDFFQTGGFGRIERKTFKREFAGASVAHYVAGHQVKFGAEYEKDTAEVIKRYSGGQQVTVFPNAVHPDMPIYEHDYWTTPDATVDDAPISALVSSPSHKIMTLYLQDTWMVSEHLTIDAGVRWDHQQIFDASGTKQVDLKKDYAPRLGLIWDPSGDHRSKVFASFGRYYEEIPMDLVIRSFSYERQPRIINYSPTGVTPDPGAEADHGTASAILGGFTEPSDPNLRNQYVREIILGGEREVMSDVAVGLKGIYRDYGEVIEDFLCQDDGTYCIGNPGQGIMKRVYTLDYSTTYPAPRPVRIFRGIQLDVTKRFSNNWQALASYLYSKLEGNYDGEYAPFTNVGADPNISAAYDYYDFFTDGRDLSKITNRGLLSNDRRHQFKVSATYTTPFGLAVGASAYYRTGTPLSRYGYSDAYGRYEFFLTRRGTEGRNPSTYDADLHLGYPLRLGPLTLNLMLDVFDVLNTQRAILVDQRWGFQEADNASPTPVNPNYGKPVLRTPPTSARLGVRLSF